jgi:K(+)-stimulated pyrophosphate-energized sodium pump
MMLPGAIAIASPLIMGFVLGPEALGGFLAGATVSGVLIGMFQNNAGGAWDNAKKSFEKGVEINGQIYKKKSEPHKAAVTGDTVGDPFKDTSGPSMNILIKLMSIVSLVIAPTLAQIHPTNIADAQKKIEIRYENKGESKDNSKFDLTVSGDDQMSQLVAELKKDNLISGGDISVEVKDGKLIVNGKELSADVMEKYNKYLQNGKNIDMKVEVK